MKRLNLFLVAIAVASVSLFTSCNKTADVTTVEITLGKTFNSTDTIKGTIAALGTLDSVTLTMGGQAVQSWPKTAFTSGAITMTTTGNYKIAITGLTSGTYKLTAIDKKKVKDEVEFYVGSLTANANETTIYCTTEDGGTKSTCASADGNTYAPATATTIEQSKVDFVYFNLSNTSKGIYSPSSIPAVINTSVNKFANWTNKNTTKFAKTTITLTNATYTAIKAIADTASITNVTGLAANNSVIFKTASGKVGIFKVNSITSGSGTLDYIKINIKVQD